jgi:hypothetical protein
MAAGMPMSRATNWKMSPFDHPFPPETFLVSAAIFVWIPTSAAVSFSNPGMSFYSSIHEVFFDIPLFISSAGYLSDIL